MEKDTERKTKPKNAGRGWSEMRKLYECRDNVAVGIASRAFRWR